MHDDIDTLPHGPEFTIDEIEVEGARRPRVQYLVRRDSLKLLREIFSNTRLKDEFAYSPARYYTTSTMTERVHFDMCSGDWWWREQVSTPSVRVFVDNTHRTGRKNCDEPARGTRRSRLWSLRVTKHACRSCAAVSRPTRSM
jgi:hypothetical protein